MQMLFSLNTGKIISRKEFAERFNVSEKTITRYEKALEEVVSIEVKTGRNGGYKMLDKHIPFKQLLSKDEIMLLKLATKSLDESINVDNENLKKAIDKINYSIINLEDSGVDAQIIPYSRVKKIDEEFSKKQMSIYEAILNKNEVIIGYQNNNGEISRRNIEPYKYFYYKGECYLIAKCLKKSEIRFFKLIRISDYIITSKKFKNNVDVTKIIEDFKENNIGIFSGEEIAIELKITPPMANTIKERVWVEDQIIKEDDKGNIIFKATMKSGPEITSWILSMKDSVEILNPQSLKEEIKETLEKMLKKL